MSKPREPAAQEGMHFRSLVALLDRDGGQKQDDSTLGESYRRAVSAWEALVTDRNNLLAGVATLEAKLSDCAPAGPADFLAVVRASGDHRAIQSLVRVVEELYEELDRLRLEAASLEAAVRAAGVDMPT